MQTEKKFNKLSILSFSLTIVGVFLIFIILFGGFIKSGGHAPIVFVLFIYSIPLVGFILSIFSLFEIIKTKEKGLIFSIISILLFIMTFLALFLPIFIN